MSLKRTEACRVCGKQFVPCNRTSKDLKAFNYRAVACSPECGEIYLKRILESRSTKEEEVLPEVENETTDDVQETENEFEAIDE